MHRGDRCCRRGCNTDLTCIKASIGCVSSASAHPRVASCQVDSYHSVPDLSLAPCNTILEWAQVQQANMVSAVSPCHTARADSNLWAVKPPGPVSSQEASRECLCSRRSRMSSDTPRAGLIIRAQLGSQAASPPLTPADQMAGSPLSETLHLVTGVQGGLQEASSF